MRVEVEDAVAMWLDQRRGGGGGAYDVSGGGRSSTGHSDAGCGPQQHGLYPSQEDEDGADGFLLPGELVASSIQHDVLALSTTTRSF